MYRVCATITITQFQDISITLEVPLLLLPTSGNYESACFYNLPSLKISNTQKHAVYHLPCLACSRSMFLRFTHVAACFNSSFLFTVKQRSTINMPYCVYHFPVVRRAGCLHILSIMTRAAANTGAPVLEWTEASFIWIRCGRWRERGTGQRRCLDLGLGRCMDDNRTQ